MKKYEISITVDQNDADFVTEICVITEKQLDKIKPLINKIKKKNGEYEYGDISEQGWDNPTKQYKFSKEEFELLHEFLPNTEYGFHTIENVEFYDIPKKTVLFDRFYHMQKLKGNKK